MAEKLFQFKSQTPPPAPREKLFVFSAPSAAPKQDTKLFQSLVRTEEKAVEKKKSILGELPKIDTSLFIDREYHLKRQLSLVRIIFAGLLVAFFAVFVFFYVQLTPGFQAFGTNVAQNLDVKNQELRNLQTDLNLVRTQTAKESLDAFMYRADNFLQKFHEYKLATDDAQKATLLADLDQIRADMYDPFEAAREKLLAKNWTALYRSDVPNEQEVTTEFDGYLRDRLRTERQQLQSDLKAAQQVSRQEELSAQLLENYELLQLVGKTQVKNILQKNIRDMGHDELEQTIYALSKSYANRLGFMNQIKQNRIPWAVTIREIIAKTKLVDEHFQTGLYDKLGGVLYSAFDFDASSGRIGITGKAKSDDGTNFSILANLIDELEGSPLFQDVNMRSFSKRFSEGGGYEGSFKIDFKLQTSATDSRDKQYNVNQQPTT